VRQQQQINRESLGMAVSDATNNGSTLGSVALNDILQDSNNIETQSNHSNATYTSNTALTSSETVNSSASAMHIYQPVNQVNASNATQFSNFTRATTTSTFNKKQGKRARSSKEKIYENEEEIKAAGLTKENEKREVRKLKNRIAAQKCREQKEVKIAQAENKVKSLESERDRLLTENEFVKRKLEHLQYRVKQHIIKNDGHGKEDFPELYGANGAQSSTDTSNYYGYQNLTSYQYQSGNPNLQISTVSYNYQQQQQQQASYSNQPISSYNSTINSMTNSPQQQQQNQQNQQNQQPSAIVNGYLPEPQQQIHQVYDNTSPGENNMQPQQHYTENNNKSEAQQPNILKRRNSQTGKKKAPISDLNLTGISNKKNSLSPNSNLPPPRRSPRIAKQSQLQNLAISGPKTKDVIDILDSNGAFFPSNTSNNNSLLSAKLTQTPKIEKEMKERMKIEQHLRTDAEPGLTPLLNNFEGPMTRSARKRKELAVFFAELP
jgi:hypothetical protein